MRTGKLVAIAVIPIIAVSVILGVYLSSLPASQGTGSTLTTGTSRVTTTSSISSEISNTTNPQDELSLNSSQVARFSSDKSWEFSVYGYVDTQYIDLNSTLTYLAPQTRVFQLQNPIDWLRVFYQNGSSVYTWAVPGALAIENVTQNEVFINFDQIPPNVMHAAGTYTIEVMPLVSTSNGTSLEQQLEVNLTVKSSGFLAVTTTTQSYSTTSSSTDTIMQVTTTGDNSST